MTVVSVLFGTVQYDIQVCNNLLYACNTQQQQMPQRSNQLTINTLHTMHKVAEQIQRLVAQVLSVRGALEMVHSGNTKP